MLCHVMSCYVMLCFCFVLFFVKLMRQKITHYKFKASVSLRRWQESHHVFGCHSSHPHSKRCRICCFSHLSHSFTCFISLCPPHFLLMTQSLSPPFLPWSVSHKHLGNTQAYHIHPWCGTHTFCPLISPLNKHTLAHTVIIHFPLRPCGRATVHVAIVTKYSSNDELSGNTTS